MIFSMNGLRRRRIRGGVNDKVRALDNDCAVWLMSQPQYRSVAESCGLSQLCAVVFQPQAAIRTLTHFHNSRSNSEIETWPIQS